MRLFRHAMPAGKLDADGGAIPGFESDNSRHPAERQSRQSRTSGSAIRLEFALAHAVMIARRPDGISSN